MVTIIILAHLAALLGGLLTYFLFWFRKETQPSRLYMVKRGIVVLTIIWVIFLVMRVKYYENLKESWIDSGKNIINTKNK